ncbi:hypothetical protein KY345_03155 [Candidatus Woesearchaeota archaeon]|nr:hypothetical protein [Candidatus Woesearchaeota archaeon]
MKHTWNVTFLLIIFFFITQITGLFIVSGYIDVPQTIETGEVVEKPLPLVERPEVEESTSWALIFGAIIIGTIIALIIIKLRLFFMWKFWFFVSVWFCLTVAFFAFTTLYIALIISLILTILKVYRSNLYIHNLSEIFIYGGLAAIFVFFMNMTSALILLVLISLYDMYSVWQSKHMIKLAKFQTSQKLFAGVFIPYELPKKTKPKKKGKKVSIAVKSAILGGGDIGFPLIFSGVVFKTLIFTNTLPIAFLKTLIISATTAMALLWLFVKAESDKYYPAMPFVSIGCLAGYGIISLIALI